MNIDKFIFGHCYKWGAAVAAILVLTATSVMGDDCNDCDDDCCIGYVTDFAGGSVIVVELNSGTILQTVFTGAGATGVAYEPEGNNVYAANELGGTLTVINARTYAAHDIFTDPGSKPNALTLAPDRQNMWVSLGSKNISGPNGDPAPGAIGVIDVHTQQVLKLISLLEPFSFPLDIQFSDDLIYVVDHFEENPPAGGNIAVLNKTSGNILKKIQVGNGTLPASVAISPNGKTIYTGGEATSRVLAINARTGSSVSIPTDAGPVKLNITRNGKFIWITNFTGGTVQKIDTKTNSVVATIPVPGSPFIGTLSPDEKTFYCTDFFNATVAVINTQTNTLERQIILGTPLVVQPIAIAIKTEVLPPS